MKRSSTYRIVLTALFAALICVATMLVQIPIPGNGGFANLGDGIILMCAFLMNPLHAVIAAGLGSMLADILAGWLTFAPGTLIVKAGVALIASLIYNRFGRNAAPRRSLISMIAAAITAEIFMVLGYFFYEAVCLGVGLAAAVSIGSNIGQGAVGVLISIIVTPTLARSQEIRELMDKTR